MPSINFNDMKISVGLSGVFHIQLRGLDEKLTKEQMAEIVYPIFDAKEKAAKQ